MYHGFVVLLLLSTIFVAYLNRSIVSDELFKVWPPYSPFLLYQFVVNLGGVIGYEPDWHLVKQKKNSDESQIRSFRGDKFIYLGFLYRSREFRALLKCTNKGGHVRI